MSRSVVLCAISMASTVVAFSSPREARAQATDKPGIKAFTSLTVSSALPDGLTDEKVRHFETAFETISQKSRVAIIVEGVPLLQSLDDDQLAHLTRSLMGLKRLTTGQILSHVAAAYDYDSDESNSHTFLLRKRYSDPNDLPFVTYEEVTRDIESVLDFVDPESTGRIVFGKRSVFWSLYDALTPDQIKRGRQGIRMSEFSPEQSALVLAAGREALLHAPTSVLRWVFNELRQFRDKRVVFKWLKLPQGEAFGFEGPFGLNDKIGPFPLNNGFRTSALGAYMHVSIKPVPAVGPTPVLPVEPFDGVLNGANIVYDPSTPRDLDRFLAPGMLTGSLPSTITLSDFAQRFASTEHSGPQITVDKRIADKPVCVYGAAFSDIDHVVRAIGAVYGLPVLESEVGKYTITLPRPRTVDKAEDASAEIMRLLPAPILRYYATQSDRITKIVESDDSEASGSPGMHATASTKAMLEHLRIAGLAQREWYLPAVRRLLVLALPAVPTRNSPPVTANALGPEVLRLMTLTLLAGDFMYEVDKLQRFSLPRSLSDPDSLVMKIQENYQSGLGQDVVSVTFGYTNNSGDFVQEGGAGGARVPTEPVDPAIANAPPKPLDPLGSLPRPR